MECLLDRKKVNSKSRKFSFYYEISTDGVAVSMLFSRPKETRLTSLGKSSADYPRRQVGVDPGKKNLVTMMDENRVSLCYTCRQRMFESKMTRHQRLLEQEKSRPPGVLEEQAALSLHSRKTNDLSEFEAYLKAKKEHDERTAWF